MPEDVRDMSMAELQARQLSSSFSWDPVLRVPALEEPHIMTIANPTFGHGESCGETVMGDASRCLESDAHHCVGYGRIR